MTPEEELAKWACEEEQRRERQALSLEPSELGRSGACHVVASILKSKFPHYRAVGIRRERALKHVGCVVEDVFIDISGVGPLPSEPLEDLEPLSLVEENRQLRELLLRPEFIEAAKAILEPYINARIDVYDASRAKKG